MHLDRINILNFKNIADTTLQFSPRVNCFLGLNGMGKSNLLEAIHYLSFSRSFSGASDSALIRHNEEMMMIQGHYQIKSGGEENISCGIVKGKRKTIKRNGKEYGKLSEHIGQFPAVVISPQDNNLITGTGEERRKLIDMVISQSDKTYLSLLIRYNKALEQRNKMLRVGFRDKLLYESIESQMGETATLIHQTRSEWALHISPIFAKYYSQIAATGEIASIAYKSILNNQTPKEIFEQQRSKDEALGYTSQGIHRDDLEMKLGDYNIRRLGSQGQLKTFTIALRFAIFETLKEKSTKTPLLLLDDIFDKLDTDRVQRIMEIVSQPHTFGQIFITDTNREHLDEILRHINSEHRLISVENGRFSPLNI